ncbi:hypothetical protein WMF38_20525 [Sorangium sp. So ce118]
MSTAITILYEDQRAHGKSFGLHTLVKACVHDALNGDRYRVEKLLERAVERKDMAERDIILSELSRERARPLRDCVLGKMPSLRALIDLLGSKLRAAAGGAAPTRTSSTPEGKRTRRGE